MDAFAPADSHTVPVLSVLPGLLDFILAPAFQPAPVGSESRPDARSANKRTSSTGPSHLLQQVVQEPHVGLLSLDGVGEESVGLPGNDLLLRRPLHADDQRGLGDVFLDDGAGPLVVLHTHTHTGQVLRHADWDGAQLGHTRTASGLETISEPEPQSGSVSGSESEPGSETKPESESESEPGSETEPESERGSESESESEPGLIK